MTNTLTPEQIAQGWIAYTGQSFDPLTVMQVYTPGGGWEFGMAGDFDFNQPTDDDYDNDPIGAANDFITRYRTFSPDLPSPPVSGEAVKLEWSGGGLYYRGRPIGFVSSWFWGTNNSISGWKLVLCGMEIDKLPYEDGEKWGDLTTYNKARTELERLARAWLPPITNEPVGVSRKDQRADDMFHFLNDKKMVAEFNRWRAFRHNPKKAEKRYGKPENENPVSISQADAARVSWPAAMTSDGLIASPVQPDHIAEVGNMIAVQPVALEWGRDVLANDLLLNGRSIGAVVSDDDGGGWAYGLMPWHGVNTVTGFFFEEDARDALMTAARQWLSIGEK